MIQNINVNFSVFKKRKKEKEIDRDAPGGPRVAKCSVRENRAPIFTNCFGNFTNSHRARVWLSSFGWIKIHWIPYREKTKI